MIVVRESHGWIVILRTGCGAARIDRTGWFSVTLSVTKAHCRRNTQARLRLTGNTRETLIQPTEKSRCDAGDAWPIVVNDQVQRHASSISDLSSSEPTKAVGHRQHTLEVKAVERLQKLRR